MSFPALEEAQGKLKAVRDQIGAVMEEAGPELDLGKVKSLEGDNTAKREAFLALDVEANALGEEVDKLKAIQRIATQNAAEGSGESGDGATKTAERREEFKSLGETLVDSDAFKMKAGAVGPESEIDFDLKTLFQTSAGFAPETTRTGRVVEFATRPLQIAELIPTVPTSQSAVVYMEETTFTNAAAETAEAATYPEAALAYTERTSPVRKIAVWIPVTDEQLEDVPAMQARLNNRLPFMIRQRLDSQILAGDGIAPNLEGIVRTGSQTQAKGADTLEQAIYKAMVKVNTVAFANADTIVMHPDDWTSIRLSTTTDGIYLWGSPADTGPERVFGTRVVPAVAQAAGTPLVFDSSQLELAVKRQMNVQVSNSHADFFINGKQAVRADIRVGLQVYRPAAVCEVTTV